MEAAPQRTAKRKVLAEGPGTTTIRHREREGGEWRRVSEEETQKASRG